jgi:hypothetical protein
VSRTRRPQLIRPSAPRPEAAAFGRPARRPPGVIVTLLAGLAAVCGCAAPFADLQGARLAGKGRVEVTGSFSSVSFSESGDSGELQREYTAQMAVGAGEKLDWRFRYTRIGPPGDGSEGSINVFGAGPKFGLNKDRVAVALPVGFAVGEGIDVGDTFQIHPTVFFTLPASDNFELNLAGKVLLSVKGGSAGVAANLGLGISSNLERWALRPEFGVLKYTDSDGYLRHLSLGLSYNLGR